MKSQIISVNNYERGFLMPEVMVSFSLMTLFIVSALVLAVTSQKLREQAVRHFEELDSTISGMATITPTSVKLYGNNTTESLFYPFTILSSNYANAWGQDSCNPRISFDESNVQLFLQGTDLGSGNASTDIEVRNGVAYLTADGGGVDSADFYIVDMSNPTYSVIISSLNTGPGASSLQVAGHYVYLANLSTVNQLQVIDIQNRSSPTIIAQLKLPLPTASTTAPLATSIFYSKGLVYLGTEKWNGNELSVIDVTIPSSPVYLGGLEIGTLINDIYVRNGLAYVAASDIGQMRVLDVRIPSSIYEVTRFSPQGWATQQGKTLSFFENILSLGRTTGGFNVLKNPEIFIFSTTSQTVAQNSQDIPGGVYGVLHRPPLLFLATKSVGHEFQIWKNDLTQMVYEKSLGFLPQAMVCDINTLYFATGNRQGIAVLKIN